MSALRFNLLFAWVVVSVPSIAGAVDAAEENIPDSYATAAELVRLRDGRALNLRCSGTGTRVIFLEAGGNSDSTSWYRVRPLLEKRVRVCAYDRAGYGFSDEGAKPRDLDANVADLRELMHAAGISLPVVLVGHSLGSNIVRRYAQEFPQEVGGMVLVDPPEQGADDAMTENWKLEDAALLTKRNSLLAACKKAAEAGQLDAPGQAAQNCLRAPPPWMGERVASVIRQNKAKVGYWRTLRSELKENRRIFSKPVSANESYGAIPMVLLSAGEPYGGVPVEVRRVLEKARRQTHDQILAASTRSKEVKVPGASHDIQLEQPEAVASAVSEVIGMADGFPAPRPAGR